MIPLQPFTYSRWLPTNVSGLVVWYRRGIGVTASAERVSNWKDFSGNGNDLAQGTGANQPIYIAGGGDRFFWNGSPGFGAGNCTTPDSATISITGNIDLIVRINALYSALGSGAVILTKGAAATSNLSYAMAFGTSGTSKVAFIYSPDGTTARTATSSTALPFGDGVAGWVRAKYNTSTGAVNFYTAADSSTIPNSWSALGTQQSVTAASIADTASALGVGSRTDGPGLATLRGSMYRALIYNGFSDAGGSLAADFNPTLQVEDATSWTSATGEVWTVNPGTNAVSGQIVARPWLVFDGAAHFLQSGAFTYNQPASFGGVVRRSVWTSGRVFRAGSAASVGSIINTTSSPRVSLNAGASACENTGLTLATKHRIVCVLNGANSSIMIDGGTATTGNPGAGNPGQITLGADGAGANFGTIQVSEWCEWASALSTADQAKFDRYLAGR